MGGQQAPEGWAGINRRLLEWCSWYFFKSPLCPVGPRFLKLMGSILGVWWREDKGEVGETIFMLKSSGRMGWVLCRCCMGSHGWCEFMSRVVLSSPEDAALLWSSLASASYNLSKMVPKPWWREGLNRCALCAWARHWCLFSILGPAVSHCVIHHCTNAEVWEQC